MKKNIEYYPHKTESHRHPKFRMLRSIYGNSTAGWAAEGRFWALNNLIASSEDCRLDLTKKRNKGVYADELGMSIKEFEDFINILVSEDCELLIEISPGIYTTDMVSETYKAVSQERESASERYKKSRGKLTSQENPETSPKISELRPKLDTNKSEVKESKLNKIKVKESEVKETSSLETFFPKTVEELSTSNFNFVKNLFVSKTRIRDPNQEKHINPILDFFTKIPEHLTDTDIRNCIGGAFEKLSPDKGVMMEFLLNNIQQRITARHEEILGLEKQKILKQAEIDRKLEKNKIAEDNERYIKQKLKEYKLFLDKNLDKFQQWEKEKLLHLLSENKLIQAGTIIEPKMESAELI